MALLLWQLRWFAESRSPQCSSLRKSHTAPALERCQIPAQLTASMRQATVAMFCFKPMWHVRHVDMQHSVLCRKCIMTQYDGTASEAQLHTMHSLHTQPSRSSGCVMPTCKLPMVTQPVCRPKYVLLQHSRLPTRSPAPTALNVS